MKREQLQELGLDKEAIEKVFALHGQTLNAEKQKHTDELSALQTKLDEANEAITKASESTESLEAIQTELDEYKTKYEETSTTLANERKQTQIEKALTDAKGKDVEYLKYKLGEVEDIDKLDELVAALKEELPSHFSDKSPAPETPTPDIEVVGNKLEKGASNKTYSFEELNNLSPQEINSNWEVVSQALQNQ